MSLKRPMVVDLEKTVKRKCLLRERDAYSLSERKIVYAASSDDGDVNFIIRSTDDGNFKAFGLSGVRNVVRAFYAILSMLEENRDTFVNNSLYGAKSLITLLDSISDEDRHEMEDLDYLDKTYKVLGDGDEEKMVMTSVSINENTRVKISLVGCPQLALLKMAKDTDGEEIIKSGVYLYQTELCKLLKYLNTTHNISPTLPGKLPPLPDLSDADLLL